MANHEELVAEMQALEQMGTQERQKLAKKRRVQQLKKWSQREKEWLIKEKQLNKRLASILNEENNGLNLKQYTTYNSNQRTKKKNTIGNTTNNNGHAAQHVSKTNSNVNGTDKHDLKDQKLAKITSNNNNTYINSNVNINNNNVDRLYANSLTPNGRVHFDVGVMLLEAAARNDYDEVKRLLMLGVSPDSINHDGLTALHQCCIDASEPIMNLLLEYGANVDARDTERWTPLHAACTCGHLNLVKILVEHDADLLAVNGDGNMPFDICEDEATLDYIESQMVARGITQEMIDLTRASNEMQMLDDLEKLVADNCDLNIADSNGVTQLHIAAANNYLSAVKFLIKHGVDVNVCDNDLWRPLHGVACWGNEQHIGVVELLVEAGASLDAKTMNDETVFDLCDNISLLDKLNQLKDELETKQASGTGRLKRTHSKTNSRVHSVRRTSVRDKNQISRREARQEAMLRVESSETLNGGDIKINEVSNGNGEQQNLVISDSSEIQSDSLAGKLVDSSLQHRHQQNHSATDQLDSGQNLDNDKTLGHSQQQQQEQQYDDDGCGEDGDDKTMIGNRRFSANQPIEQRESTGVEKTTFRSQQELHDSSSCDGNHVRQQTTAPSEKSQPNQYLNTNNVARVSTLAINNDDLALTTTKSASDLNGKLPAQSTTIVQVHFAPLNYTLSNLKKHRSDLRMRSAGSITSANTTVVQLDCLPITRTEMPDSSSCAPGGRGTTMSTASIDDTATHNNGILVNGGDNSEASVTTFRKFHGEPSGAIEDAELRRRHKCCIII